MQANPSKADPALNDTDEALSVTWSALIALSRKFRHSNPSEAGTYGLGASGELRRVPSDSDGALLLWRPKDGWSPVASLATATRDLLDLYLPLCGPSPGTRPRTIAHLGQSLDGHIATDTGDSCFVTGPENILHLHRLRALCDAVIVGAGTVAADDPRLTTRLVRGDSPLRVVLDPQRRLSPDYRVFADGEAETILVCGADGTRDQPARVGQAEVLYIPVQDRRLDLAELLTRLWRKGVRSVFIEGGGATVSCFLEADLLDRLQIAVAPLIIGSGRPGVRLPTVMLLMDCLRPNHRVFRMGGDILFDCELGVAADGAPVVERAAAVLARVL